MPPKPKKAKKSAKAKKAAAATTAETESIDVEETSPSPEQTTSNPTETAETASDRRTRETAELKALAEARDARTKIAFIVLDSFNNGPALTASSTTLECQRWFTARVATFDDAIEGAILQLADRASVAEACNKFAARASTPSEVKSRLRRFANGEGGTWREALHTFIRELHDPAAALQAKVTILGMTSQRGERVATFKNRLDTAVHEAGMLGEAVDGATLTAIFLQGLHQIVRGELLRRQSSILAASFQAAFAAAQLVEEELISLGKFSLEQPQKTTAIPPTEARGTPKSRRRQGGLTPPNAVPTGEGRAPQRNPGSGWASAQTYEQANNVPFHERTQEQKTIVRNTRAANNWCTYCGSPEHQHASCPRTTRTGNA